MPKNTSRTRNAGGAGRLEAGNTIAPMTVQTLDGQKTLPSPSGLTHVQLRRFAGCPICNLHLRSVVKRVDEIKAAGIEEVVVFHSSAAELATYQPQLPLSVVPDPDRGLYKAFGAERSLRAVLNPRIWRRFPRVAAGAVRRMVRDRQAPPLRPTGGQLGLPADLLIDADGRVRAVKYGAHAYDQWSVDELLSLAGTRR